MIYAHFDTPEQEVTRAYGVYQYDWGQKLQVTGLESLDLPTHTEVHFAVGDEETSLTRISTVSNGILVVDVPFKCLQYAELITADIYVLNEDEDGGQTIKRILFTPKHKAKPDDDITPDEERTVDAILSELNAIKEEEETDLTAIEGYMTAAQSAAAAAEAALAEIADKTIRRYGVRWLADSTARDGTRLGDAASITAAGVQIGDTINDNDFDSIYPWSNIRRCNGDWNTETGLFEVTCYEYGTDGVKNEDFATDGSNGNVWVEIPLFYAKHYYDSEKEEKWVSGSPGDGYYIPKKLQRSLAHGQNKTYIAAFRASEDENGFMASVAGALPKYGSFDTFMTAYKAEGVGLSGTTTEDEEIIDLLMDVEFATRDQQNVMLSETSRYWGSDYTAQVTETDTNRIIVTNTAANYFRAGEYIGVGTSCDSRTVFDRREILEINAYDDDNKEIVFDGDPVDITAGTHCVTNMPLPTGTTEDLTAPSGTPANDGRHDCRYRYIETPYDKQFDIIQDLLVNDYQTYFCTDMHGGNYSNVLTDDYEPVSYQNTEETGVYIRNMGFDERYPHIKNPVEIGNGASSTAGFCAYCNSASGLRAVWRGGGLASGRHAGRSYSLCNYAPSPSSANRGSRRSYTA